MKFKMAPNSMFAVLLRSPWWISFLIAGVITAICGAFLSKDLVLVGAMGSLPFWVIGCVALTRQWHEPSAAQLQSEFARVSGLSWRDFSAELVSKFEKQGFLVERLSDATAKKEGSRGSGADFQLSKNGETTVVAAKRYKAVTHGVEALQALLAQKVALGADRAIYVCLGRLSEQAEKFAKAQGVQHMRWYC